MEATRLRAGGRPGGSRQLPGLPARRTGCDIAPAHLSDHPSTRPTHPSISAHSAEHWLLGRIARTQCADAALRNRLSRESGPGHAFTPGFQATFFADPPPFVHQNQIHGLLPLRRYCFFPEHIGFSQPGLREAQPKVGLCSPLFHIYFFFIFNDSVTPLISISTGPTLTKNSHGR